MSMTRPQKLDDNEITSLLDTLEGWQRAGDEITKQFRFDTFAEAVAFIGRVAPACDELNHHPTWCNTYNRVDVQITTHDAGGLSQLDFDLAGRMEDLY